MTISKPRTVTSKKPDESTNVLVGQWFHSLTPDGRIKWQGHIVGMPQPGVYLVQCFEWFMGEPSVRQLVKLEDMLDWLFYPDDEAMKFSYEHGVASHKRTEVKTALINDTDDELFDKRTFKDGLE